jgi:hypothetical protein
MDYCESAEVAGKIEVCVKAIQKGMAVGRAIDYIDKHAPKGKVVGARYMVVVENPCEHIPPVGTIGVLVCDDNTDFPYFKWPDGSTDKDRDRANAPIRYVRRITNLMPETKKEKFTGADDTVDAMIYAFQGFNLKREKEKEEKPMEIKDNCIVINGKRAELTPDQLKALGIEPPKKSVFDRVGFREKYAFISADGKVSNDTNDETDYDKGVFNAANQVVDTPEGRAILERQAEREVLNRLLWRYAMEHGGVPKIGTQHWVISQFRDKEFLPDAWTCKLTQGSVRFISRQICQNAIDEILLPYLAAHPDFEW